MGGRPTTIRVMIRSFGPGQRKYASVLLSITCRGEGASDDLRIEIPPGSYKAVLTTRDSRESYPAHHQSASSDNHHTNPASLAGEQRDSIENGADKSGIGPSGDEIEQSSSSGSRWIRARSTPALAVIASVAVGMGVFGFAAG